MDRVDEPVAVDGKIKLKDAVGVSDAMRGRWHVCVNVGGTWVV